ncbi:uncharacterized protein PGTG_12547 [Puccinia graminis f. sp. tritici CRL 75-36-700-3]|uniref:Uncharacterized protein n=1 Tax=Puccinia graminis f. sp. tritici (strain CRL 75-36-700-3 / race SCCL) TaxID=418459 RepID=E3KV00_PUCGT|nr:uncharacterized protein PGTG_12547 [Puccinia graminis f. sp. tritici CRL 75-36-700-3]EFP88100.1 hypothetical protein PGTG_12547 [Puccinia graminis f. sp. tritici CRL 75-36-700-3]
MPQEKLIHFPPPELPFNFGAKSVLLVKTNGLLVKPARTLILRMEVHLGTHQDPQIPLHLNQLQTINKDAKDQADIQTYGLQVTSPPHPAELLSQMPRSHHLLQHLKKPHILSWLSLNVMWTNNWLWKEKNTACSVKRI